MHLNVHSLCLFWTLLNAVRSPKVTEGLVVKSFHLHTQGNRVWDNLLRVDGRKREGRCPSVISQRISNPYHTNCKKQNLKTLNPTAYQTFLTKITVQILLRVLKTLTYEIRVRNDAGGRVRRYRLRMC